MLSISAVLSVLLVAAAAVDPAPDCCALSRECVDGGPNVAPAWVRYRGGSTEDRVRCATEHPGYCMQYAAGMWLCNSLYDFSKWVNKFYAPYCPGKVFPASGGDVQKCPWPLVSPTPSVSPTPLMAGAPDCCALTPKCLADGLAASPPSTAWTVFPSGSEADRIRCETEFPGYCMQYHTGKWFCNSVYDFAKYLDQFYRVSCTDGVYPIDTVNQKLCPLPSASPSPPAYRPPAAPFCCELSNFDLLAKLSGEQDDYPLVLKRPALSELKPIEQCYAQGKSYCIAQHADRTWHCMTSDYFVANYGQLITQCLPSIFSNIFFPSNW